MKEGGQAVLTPRGLGDRPHGARQVSARAETRSDRAVAPVRLPKSRGPGSTHGPGAGCGVRIRSGPAVGRGFWVSLGGLGVQQAGQVDHGWGTRRRSHIYIYIYICIPEMAG